MEFIDAWQWWAGPPRAAIVRSIKQPARGLEASLGLHLTWTRAGSTARIPS